MKHLFPLLMEISILKIIIDRFNNDLINTRSQKFTNFPFSTRNKINRVEQTDEDQIFLSVDAVLRHPLINNFVYKAYLQTSCKLRRIR